MNPLNRLPTATTWWLFLLAMSVISLNLTGCSTAGYYSQAIRGHFELMGKRQPIDALLADPTTDDKLKARLNTVLAIRTYAETELLLPVGNSYSQYADLERPHVVWNVFAAPPLSLQPRTWCYPVAGCVSYRGYFKEADAQAYAARLQQQGLDVYVGGSSAYSTLGWFADPVLNTFIHQDDAGLAALLFHELAHRKLYIKDDTTFNESYATAVELIGVQHWLAQRPDGDQLQQRYLQRLERRNQFIALISDTNQALRTLYASPQTDAEKALAKTALIAELKQHHQALKQRWQGYRGYDRWFNQPINNAQLITVASYYDWVPAFLALYQENGNDLARFYTEVQALAKQKKPARDQRLQALLEQADGNLKLADTSTRPASGVQVR